MQLTKIAIRDFKKIKSLDLPLEEVNLLIGGNNSGKSSVLQAIHFAITCLRSANQYGKSKTQPATTLGINQFSFLPTTEIMALRHRALMTQDSGPSISFFFNDETGQSRRYSLHLKRGKNANVALTYSSGTEFYKKASDLTAPFSIYVPGLAGLSLLEERRANAVVTSGLAQGDSNLYLRNVLLRLCEDRNKLLRLHNMLDPIFPGMNIVTDFDENINQYISASLSQSGSKMPLELSGTGSLQALQLAAYVTLYEPKLLLLDEPDAHLHPGNQKQLVDLIFNIASQTGTIVVMASHSRHVLDRVSGNTLGSTVWLKNGVLQDQAKADLPLLLDIGALDAFEEVSKPQVKNLLFTEDSNTQKIEAMLSANDNNLSDIKILPFDGVDNFSACRTVVEFFLSLGPGRKAVIYRDGDGMTAAEKTWLAGKASENLPNNTKYLIGELTDIEHYYCQPKHLKTIFEITEEQAQEVVDGVVADGQAWFTGKLVNKRSDLKNKVLKNCGAYSSTEELTRNGIGFELCLGKAMVGRILQKFDDKGAKLKNLYEPSEALKTAEFQNLFDF